MSWSRFSKWMALGGALIVAVVVVWFATRPAFPTDRGAYVYLSSKGVRCGEPTERRRNVFEAECSIDGMKTFTAYAKGNSIELALEHHPVLTTATVSALADAFGWSLLDVRRMNREPLPGRGKGETVDWWISDGTLSIFLIP